MQSLFASSPKREDNFLLGMAMGGNAAVATEIKTEPEKETAETESISTIE